MSKLSSKYLPIIGAFVGIAMIIWGAGLLSWWKPTGEMNLSSPKSAQAPYIVTGENILASTGYVVTIKATAPAGTKVHLAVGTAGDVAAWIANQDYDEVTAFASATELEVSRHKPANSAKSEHAGKKPAEKASSEAKTEQTQGASPEDKAKEDAGADKPKASPEKPKGNKAKEKAKPETPEEKAAKAKEKLAAELKKNPAFVPEGYQKPAVVDAPAAVGEANPIASDMWLARQDGDGSAQIPWEMRDGRWSVIAATDGKGPAPRLTLTWQTSPSNSKPIPLIVIGSVLFVVAAIYLILLAITEHRSALRRAESKERTRARLLVEGIDIDDLPDDDTLTRRDIKRAQRASREAERQSRRRFRRHAADPADSADSADTSGTDTKETPAAPKSEEVEPLPPRAKPFNPGGEQ